MAFVEVNGIAATSLSLRLPISGAWDATAEVTTSDVSTVSGRVTLRVGETELSGTTKRAGTDAGGKTTLRIVAGAGALDAAVEPLGYDPTTTEAVVAAILAKGGEVLDPTSDPTALLFLLPHWVRMGKADVAMALRRLIEAVGVTWRHSLNGLIWIGTDTYPEISPEYVLEQEAPTEGFDVIALESLAVLPGKTFRGQKISAVEYTVDSTRCRARVSYGQTRAGEAAEFGLWVRRETAHTDYFGSYDVRVVQQNGDGTLEIIPDSPRIPGLSRIPIRSLPGVRVKVSPGARATLRFLDGLPSKPYVSDFEQSNLVELLLGEGANHSLARGDATQAWLQAILNVVCVNGSAISALVVPPIEFPIPFAVQVRSDGPAKTP